MNNWLLLLIFFLAYNIVDTNKINYSKHVREVNTEKRRKIIVLDTGITIQQYKKNYTCRDIEPKSFVPNESGFIETGGHRHGENLISIIGSTINVSKYCILSIKYTSGYSGNLYSELLALKFILTLKNVAAINMSFSGSIPNGEEKTIIKKLLQKKVNVITAAGNSSVELSKNDCWVFPACYKLDFKSNFYIVKSKLKSSNWSKDIDLREETGYNVGTPPMSGTSQAAAQFTGMLFSYKEREFLNED